MQALNDYLTTAPAIHALSGQQTQVNGVPDMGQKTVALSEDAQTLARQMGIDPKKLLEG